MSSALRGLRVWLTRPEPALHTSAELWRARGAHVVPAPTVEVRAVNPSPAELAAFTVALERVKDVVVALPSPRAAENFVAHFGARTSGSPWRVAAVGAASAERARALGLEVRLVSSRALGRELAEEIVQHLAPRLVLLPSSDRRRPELGDALRSAGVEVLDLTVHRTEPVDRIPAPVDGALRLGRLDLVAAYSPSALAFVTALAPRARETLDRVGVAALGPTTAAAAREQGLRVVVEAEDPGEEQLLRAAERWWCAL